MMIRRVHVGCGIRNPFGRWTMYGTLILAIVVSVPVNLLMRTFWGELAWLPWVADIAAILWWERVHSPDKMYRTWTP